MGDSKQAKKSKKEPKTSSNFKTNDKQTRVKIDPDDNHAKPSWRMGSIDLDCKWSFAELNIDRLHEIISKLRNFETMTWQEILDASGGRKRGNGNNNHEVPVSDLIAAARKRLKELKLDDQTSLFSLRLKGKQRIWGILDGHVLRLLWHDDNHQICPKLK